MDITNRAATSPTMLKPLTAVTKTDSVLRSLSDPEPVSATQSNPLMAQSFESVLSKALEPVNNLQLQSAELDGQLAQGKLEYVHQAMVMAQKASLALDMTMQLRNKVVEAYQEIMRTQL
ncbi:MAG TPA: flagellar hook-basal body complex protein FliE [Firmicutes bacterium]|jgi:flagellar hook-basal body complex protein FliE|nr:flagellar hook-basal body complex protein FliE [Bacillota bacterium]